MKRHRLSALLHHAGLNRELLRLHRGFATVNCLLADIRLAKKDKKFTKNAK